MTRLRSTSASAAARTSLALRALQDWGPRQALVAAVATIVIAVTIGVPTVLIPNPVFSREIPVEPWSYPVWVVTSVLAGLLTATYVRPKDATPADPDEKPSRAGMVGGLLTWFAVGCPVCNKLVLITLGYSGALTWFAPFQPVLAAGGVVLTAAALVVRLSGQLACPVPAVTRG